MISYADILRIIFSHEAIIVLITGEWKSGKTNVGLRIAEDLRTLGLIKKAGTNIKIKENDFIKYIEDFDNLNKFHFDDPINPTDKLFIFDEAGKLATKRRAMNKVNVKWMEFIPELSKGRMKLLVITQGEFLTDSIFTNTEFTRAKFTTWISKNKRNYGLVIESELIKEPRIFIRNFPKSNIEYSPYESAQWFIEARTIQRDEYLCCQIARMYALDNKSTTVIANELSFHRSDVIRYLKRHIRHTFNQLNEIDILTLAQEKGLNVEANELKVP